MTIDTNVIIAFLAGERAVTQALTRLRKLPDAIIAATALLTHTPVVTRNVKDFKRVKNLQVVEV